MCVTCGGSRSGSLSPAIATLLGDDDGSAPRLVRIESVDIIPSKNPGDQVYVKGSAVQAAIEDGLLADVTAPIPKRPRKRTMFEVDTKDGTTLRFPSSSSARAYAQRTGGDIRVVVEDA